MWLHGGVTQSTIILVLTAAKPRISVRYFGEYLDVGKKNEAGN